MLLLEGWARDGLTDEQIAANMGISPASLYNWKKKHLEIFEALKKGKEIVDYEVENALLKRALGYEYETKVTEVKANGKGDIIEKQIKTTKKVVPPDVTAAIYWLNNRRPDKYRRNPIGANSQQKERASKLFEALEDEGK